MSASSPNSGDVKMLPNAGAATARPAAGVPTGSVPTGPHVIAAPIRQMAEMPREELDHLAEEYGLDPTRFRTRQDLVAGIHRRRQLIAGLDREAMLDVIRWGRRPVAANATNEQLALEIARIRSMKFGGLSQRGLVTLGRLRGIECGDNEPVPKLIRRLRKGEGVFARLNRKRREVIAGIVCKIIGEDDGAAADYQFLPPADGAGAGTATPTGAGGGRGQTMRDEIEDAGLFGGIANRVKKTADSYINQKLDEIEARIDRKLDEIDRRLGEWRDKEIANRIRILKITLWASVIVAAVSLVYSYVKVYFLPGNDSPAPIRQLVQPRDPAPPQQHEPQPGTEPEGPPAPARRPAATPPVER